MARSEREREKKGFFLVAPLGRSISWILLISSPSEQPVCEDRWGRFSLKIKDFSDRVQWGLLPAGTLLGYRLPP